MMWNNTNSKWIYQNVQRYNYKDWILTTHRNSVGMANIYLTQQIKIKYEDINQSVSNKLMTHELTVVSRKVQR